MALGSAGVSSSSPLSPSRAAVLSSNACAAAPASPSPAASCAGDGGGGSGASSEKSRQYGTSSGPPRPEAGSPPRSRPTRARKSSECSRSSTCAGLKPGCSASITRRKAAVGTLPSPVASSLPMAARIAARCFDRMARTPGSRSTLRSACGVGIISPWSSTRCVASPLSHSSPSCMSMSAGCWCGKPRRARRRTGPELVETSRMRRGGAGEPSASMADGGSRAEGRETSLCCCCGSASSASASDVASSTQYTTIHLGAVAEPVGILRAPRHNGRQWPWWWRKKWNCSSSLVQTYV